MLSIKDLWSDIVLAQRKRYYKTSPLDQMKMKVKIL